MPQLPQQPLRVGSDLITPVLLVRDLGIYIDADVSMRSHVMRTKSACFAVLRQLRGIHRSIPRLSSSPCCRVCAIAAGLLQPRTGRHSIIHCSALADSDERGRTKSACLLVIKVRSHHAARTPTSLADGLLADRIQAGRSCL